MGNWIKIFEKFDAIENKLEEFKIYFNEMKYILDDDFHKLGNKFGISIEFKFKNADRYKHGYIEKAGFNIYSKTIKYDPRNRNDDPTDHYILEIQLVTTIHRLYTDENRDEMNDRYTKSREEFIDSDEYLEFEDRIKDYCDENGLLFSGKNLYLFNICVKKA